MGRLKVQNFSPLSAHESTGGRRADGSFHRRLRRFYEIFKGMLALPTRTKP
jgi:hypothetical protein